jgi:GAF domain-containing protein
MPDLTAVHDICGRLDRGEIDRNEFVEELARGMAPLMGCSRCAVRLLVHHETGLALRTLALYDTGARRLRAAPDIASANAGPYFDALSREGVVVAADVRTHPLLAPFLDAYFGPQDVRSLLDVGFSVNGVLYGTFSCEEVHGTMAWTQPQVNLMRQISARASLAVMHALNAEIDTTPGALWEPSTPNRLITMPAPLDDGKDDDGRPH